MLYIPLFAANDKARATPRPRTEPTKVDPKSIDSNGVRNRTVSSPSLATATNARIIIALTDVFAPYDLTIP